MINISSAGNGIRTDDLSYTVFFRDGIGYMTHYMNGSNAIGIFASSDPNTKMVIDVEDTEENVKNLSSVYTKDGNTVYYTTTSGPVKSVNPLSDKESIDEYRSLQDFIWSMIYGEPIAKWVSIPVIWRSKYRAEPYRTSFSILVEG